MDGLHIDIRGLLLETQRAGMDELLDYMEREGYFTAPASSKYHNVFEGGLASHSWDVYNLLSEYNDDLSLELQPETVSIPSLLHDICKMGLYIGEKGIYQVNKSHPKGHGKLSVEILQNYIKLSQLEEKMILYHMGVYGLEEFEPGKGEYTLRGGGLANVWYHHPAVKVMYFCDELATLKEKVGNGK